MKPVLAWHFVADTKLLRDGQKLRKNKTYRYNGPLEMCRSGLHASLNLLDALRYAPGAVVCRVECSGRIVNGDDKLVCTERKVLAYTDATLVLHYFAVWCATEALKREREAGREPDQRSWDALKVKKDWLDGNASDQELAAARAAAWDAARAAAWDAAPAAAAAWDAAWDAARAAAWDAARAAAWDAAADVAWVAAWDKQNRKLESMLKKELGL